jgi:hypothetical protein
MSFARSVNKQFGMMRSAVKEQKLQAARAAAVRRVSRLSDDFDFDESSLHCSEPGGRWEVNVMSQDLTPW